MPYAVLDILEAPVPFLVGLHSRYLSETPPKGRPQGVVFVNLDCDEVHLGFEDDSEHPREPPCLPERQAVKLRGKLDKFASSIYVAPASGKVGTVTSGNGQIRMMKRISLVASGPTSISSVTRDDILHGVDMAYSDMELQEPISGFISEHGQITSRKGNMKNPVTPNGKGSKVLKWMTSKSLSEQKGPLKYSPLLELSEVSLAFIPPNAIWSHNVLSQASGVFST
jgi:hypothetical protein